MTSWRNNFFDWPRRPASAIIQTQKKLDSACCVQYDTVDKAHEKIDASKLPMTNKFNLDQPFHHMNTTTYRQDSIKRHSI
mmetsp:Transcript_2804/g.4111  ORF Transcript_2804/g.4111 Transcript_2804/m.4111 type:complete len:80 (+) Transcript_2804:1050-1289(+)